MGKQYEMAFAIGAKVNGNFGAAFRSAAQSVQSLQTTIDNLNKRQSDISSYERTQNAIEKVTSKLELYQQQYANLKREIEENGNASAKEQNQLLAKGKAIDDAKQKLSELQEKLQKTGEALQAEGVDLNNLGDASKKAGDDIAKLRKEQEDVIANSDKFGDSTAKMAESLMDVAAALHIVDGLKKIGEAFKECAEESIAFENSMASVKRTVGGNDSFINKLGDDFKQMSTVMPITTGELAQIATTAGQLGIAQENVESFTTVMAKLATTTDLSADEAATMLAQFSNITGVKEYDRLGSTIAKLGDATATTASKVTQMSQGMAASASLAGMKPTDIMAISAAVGSLGIEAQAGSTAMSTLINNMYKATETGEKLTDFAKVAGMSGEQFKKAWQDDAAGALNSFIQGLNDTERNGKSAIVLLDELGINNVRQTKAILGLASAGDLLTRTLSMANQAWDENTALDEKAGIMYETTQAKITMMENAFSNLKTSIGDAFSPAIADAAQGLTNLMQPISEFISANPAIVQGIGAAVGVIGTATAALTGFVAVSKLATAASVAFAGATGVALAPVMAVVAGVAGLVGIVTALSSAFKESQLSMEDLDADFDNLTQKASEQQQIIDLCENYKELANQVDHTVDVSKKLDDFQDVDISLTANADATVAPTDFLTDGSTDITLNGIAGAAISGIDLITGGTDIPLDGTAGAKIPGEDLVSDKGVKLHATSDGITLSADVFVDSTEVAFTATWANEAEMKADIDKFKADAQQAKTDLENGKQALSDMQKHERELIAQLQHAPTQMTKDSLAEQINTVRDAISEQEGKVNDLTASYDNAAAKYLIAAQAAETLAEHTNALAEAQAALGISTDEMVGDYEKQTKAINDYVDAKEREAQANLAAIRSDIYANAGKQAKIYADSLNDGANAQTRYNAAQSKAAVINKYAGQSLAEVNARYAFLLQSLNDMENGTSAHAKGSAYWNEILSEANEVHNALHDTETSFEEINELASQGKSDWVSNWKHEFKQNEWDNIIASVNDGIVTTNENLTEFETLQQTYIENMTNAVNTGAISLEEAHSLMMTHFAEEEDGAAIAEKAYKQVEAAVNDYRNAAKEAAEGPGMTADEAQQKLQPIIDKIENLSKAYKDAYDAAYQSISGQFQLFEEMSLAQASEDAQGAVDGMIGALNSQSDYITQYMENLATATEMGVSEGLIKNLSDGSEQSAQILADIVAGGADKIDELNQAFGKVEEGKKKFSDSVAEMQTKFTENMTKYKAELDSAVAAMDKSGEAAAYGSSVVSSFAAAAAGKVGEVAAAFNALSAVATIKASMSLSIGGMMGGIKNPVLNAAGMIGSVLGSFGFKLPGFAGGTASAPPGYAIVGEDGPELMRLRGGERIFPADETQQALDNTYGGASSVNALAGATGANIYTIDFKPQYNITGSSNADEIRTVLEQQSAGLRSQLEEMLDDIENDRNRRKYA